MSEHPETSIDDLAPLPTTDLPELLPFTDVAPLPSEDIDLAPLPSTSVEAFEVLAEATQPLPDVGPVEDAPLVAAVVDEPMEEQKVEQVQKQEPEAVEEPGEEGEEQGDEEQNQDQEMDTEQAEQPKEVDDPALRELLASLHQNRPDEVDTALSSPLSEVPPLPKDFEEPEPPKSPTPSPPSPEPHAPVSPVSRAMSGESSKRKPTAQKGKTVKRFKKAKDEVVDEIDDLESETEAIAPRKAQVAEETNGDEDSLRSVLPEEEEGLKRKVAGAKQPRTAKRSRKALDAALGIERDGSAPIDKIHPRPKVLTDAQLKVKLLGHEKEVQVAPCLRPRYAKWGKCTQCVAKAGGDSCRFRGYRVFPIDKATTDIIGTPWFESTESREEMTPLPREFNIPLTLDHIARVERTVAPLLLPLITRELRHIVRNTDCIRRQVDTAKHRSVCDFCSSTIFGGYFFCKKCGRDFCLQCERFFPPSIDKILESPLPLPDAVRPRLLKCVGGLKEKSGTAGGLARILNFHSRADLQPVSRFEGEELKGDWLGLAELILHGSESLEDRVRILGLRKAESDLRDALRIDAESAATPQVPQIDKSEEASADVVNEEDDKLNVADELTASLYTKSTNPSIPPVPDPAELEDISLPFMFIPGDKLDNLTFETLWSRGEPLVVDGLAKDMRETWTPDAFIDRFGREPCWVVNCETGSSLSMTVGKFFLKFKEAGSSSSQILKLKDWPSAADFRMAYPDLYNSFCEALPVPDFTRREGVLNLYSHFPPGPTRPDIGPKMYNAFAARETKGGHGSTRLHMDVADAVNIMVYASPRPDGQPGCAVWDLFRADDADKIRKYLVKKFQNTHKFYDPIHSQLFYLDSAMRKELLESYGVVSWRVYQYPGQAVFIPAGCAHQVCNLADCIKIALDFVSPHNVKRCQRLTQDFRTENVVKAWKEDVLQLYNVMWFAWRNCRETRDRWEADKGRQVKEKAEQDALGKWSPSKTVGRFWSPVVSSMRDEPAENGLLSPVTSSARDEPVEQTTTLHSALTTQVVADTGNPATPNGESSATVDPALQSLPHRLLDAALTRPDPPPPKPKPVKRPAPPTPTSAPLPLPPASAPPSASADVKPRIAPKEMSIKEMIKKGMLPIDFAVSAARLAMGEGGDEDSGGWQGVGFNFGNLVVDITGDEDEETGEIVDSLDITEPEPESLEDAEPLVAVNSSESATDPSASAEGLSDPLIVVEAPTDTSVAVKINTDPSSIVEPRSDPSSVVEPPSDHLVFAETVTDPSSVVESATDIPVVVVGEAHNGLMEQPTGQRLEEPVIEVLAEGGNGDLNGQIEEKRDTLDDNLSGMPFDVGGREVNDNDDDASQRMDLDSDADQRMDIDNEANQRELEEATTVIQGLKDALEGMEEQDM
ncbi:hypothetical protein BCR39DRAFT_524154 [Naematelia encephala]|uniref:JmjC domain-containing protein n=1 Tax=Naematelia encephala TaxID=71784 RepID=A0A1Y2BC43_9TREE|nr:hypothetical protein BCR39DRAFT_524154 [Naematelia encephala]